MEFPQGERRWGARHALTRRECQHKQAAERSAVSNDARIGGKSFIIARAEEARTIPVMTMTDPSPPSRTAPFIERRGHRVKRAQQPASAHKSVEALGRRRNYARRLPSLSILTQHLSTLRIPDIRRKQPRQRPPSQATPRVNLRAASSRNKSPHKTDTPIARLALGS